MPVLISARSRLAAESGRSINPVELAASEKSRWRFSTTKVDSGVAADIVMESLHARPGSECNRLDYARLSATLL
jgi:hypothetical protein